MILQALAGYYDRLKAAPDSAIPPYGFARQTVQFALVLNRDGICVQVRDLRLREGAKVVAPVMVLPSLGKKRAAGIDPNFLWDGTTYVLGNDDKGKPERTQKAFEAFRELHHAIGDGLDDEGMRALLAFLDAWNPADAPSLTHWDEMAGGFLVFRLDGAREYLHERPALAAAWERHGAEAASATRGMCLITGATGPIAQLHAPIKGVSGAQSSGASLVSFNLPAFTSYGKAQNFNAPIGEASAFAYTTALNHLLDRNNRQKTRIGDATTVFWTERDSPVEGFMGLVLDPSDDEAETGEVRAYLDAVRRGVHPEGIDPGIRFYILGLAPNASRLSVRFWHVSTVGDIGRRLGEHFNDLAIVRQYDRDPLYPPLWRLLRETAPQGKSENIPATLVGAFMRSILTGAPYPQGLLATLIARNRADSAIGYLRAALIKACLVRNERIHHSTGMEVGMALDTESTNAAYRLGRLFAALEKAQKDAIPGANTTIRERYFGAASATPKAVFPVLIRLAQHHITKTDNRYCDRLIQEILGDVASFPAHLTLDEQGLFALGYYHQRQNIYKKKTTDPAPETDAA